MGFSLSKGLFVLEEGENVIYQLPPPLLLELEVVTPVLVDPSAAVEVVELISKACTLEHMLLYQSVMLP